MWSHQVKNPSRVSSAFIKSNNHTLSNMGNATEASSSIQGDVPTLVQFHYNGRQVVSSAGKTFEEFESNARTLLDIASDHEVVMSANLSARGTRMLSEATWPLLEGHNADIQVLTRIPESRPQHAEKGDIEVHTRTGAQYPFLIPDFSLATVGDLTKALRDLDGIPVDQQRILYNGRELEEGRTLDQYQIAAGATLGLVRRSRSSDDWSKAQSSLRKWQASPPPTVRIPLRRDSDLGGPVLIRLAETDRQAVAMWKESLEDFEAEVHNLFEIPLDHHLVLSVELKAFGSSKMELDTQVWPLMENQIRAVWISPVAPTVQTPEAILEDTKQPGSTQEKSAFHLENILPQELFVQLALSPSTYLILHLLLFLLTLTVNHPGLVSFISFASCILLLFNFVAFPIKEVNAI